MRARQCGPGTGLRRADVGDVGEDGGNGQHGDQPPQRGQPERSGQPPGHHDREGQVAEHHEPDRERAAGQRQLPGERPGHRHGVQRADSQLRADRDEYREDEHERKEPRRPLFQVQTASATASTSSGRPT